MRTLDPQRVDQAVEPAPVSDCAFSILTFDELPTLGYMENEVSALSWRKSSRSGGQNGGNCVEVETPFSIEFVAVRDTKDRDGHMLTVSPQAWRAFLSAIK